MEAGASGLRLAHLGGWLTMRNSDDNLVLAVWTGI